MSVFRQQLQVFIDTELSPGARAARFAAAAVAARDNLISTGQASARYDTYVDGSLGRPESQVDPAGGTITYAFNYMGAAAAFALGFLRARAPVLTGQFAASFVVAVDGRPVPASAFSADAVPRTAEVIIYNSEPYARKVDVQISGRVHFRFRVPPGMFSDAAQAVTRQYGGTIKAVRVGNIVRPGVTVSRKGRQIQTPAIILTHVN